MRCGKHVPEQRGFCALESGHKDPCNKFPRDQGVVADKELTKQNEVIARMEKRLAAAKKKRDEILAKTKVKCMGSFATIAPKHPDSGCKTKTPIADLTFIQTHWYVEPHGCTEGDYWNAGEGQFVCPECGVTNRLFDRPEVEKLKSFFKEIKDTYGR